jgi:hypothetical protein
MESAIAPIEQIKFAIAIPSHPLSSESPAICINAMDAQTAVILMAQSV